MKKKPYTIEIYSELNNHLLDIAFDKDITAEEVLQRVCSEFNFDVKQLFLKPSLDSAWYFPPFHLFETHSCVLYLVPYKYGNMLPPMENFRVYEIESEPKIDYSMTQSIGPSNMHICKSVQHYLKKKNPLTVFLPVAERKPGLANNADYSLPWNPHFTEDTRQKLFQLLDALELDVKELRQDVFEISKINTNND